MVFFKKSPPDSPIAIAQEALAEGRRDPSYHLADSIDRIVTEGLWYGNSSYPEFGEFAIALVRDGGLGVRSTTTAKRLKFALMESGHLREWTSVLVAIMRPPGRPETRNNDESFRPFYEVKTSMNVQDRALVTLCQKHPQVFEDVCQRKCTISAGAIKAGLKPSVPPRWQMDLEAIFGMSVDAQVVLLRELFNGLGQETQAVFIAQVFEGVLGTGLAQKWGESPSCDDAA